MIKAKRCIFFDRDGTLIDTPNTKTSKPKSFNNLNQVHLKKEVIEVCHHLKKDNSWKEEVDEFANLVKSNGLVKVGNLDDVLNVMKQ